MKSNKNAKPKQNNTKSTALVVGRPKPAVVQYMELVKRNQADKSVENYLRMVLNPFHAEYGSRYPDETLCPTSLAQFFATQTFTVGGNGNMITGIQCAMYNSTVAGPLVLPSGWVPGTPPTLTSTGYGAQQAAYNSFVSSNRTLAAGIKVRVLGLPSNNFIPAGTLYLLQADQTLGDVLSPLFTTGGEAFAAQLVAAGKGFQVTLAEVYANGGVHLPYLPRGPNSFMFTDPNIPAGTVTLVGTNTAVNPPQLTAVLFGAIPGTSLRIDFSTHAEYVPTGGAAGLTHAEIGDVDMHSRDMIHKGIGAISKSISGATAASQIVPMLRAPEDKKLNLIKYLVEGANVVRNVAGMVRGAGAGSAMSVLGSLLSAL